MATTNPIETATQTTVIEGRSSRFGTWETLPDGVFEGPDQVREANDALESLLALGGDYTAENTRVRTRLG